MARHNLNFEMIGIPLGARLIHVSDPKLIAIVVDQNPPRVACKGKVRSLMEAAQLAYQNPRDIQGSLFWIYDGETLQARGDRFEQYHRHE